MIPAVCDWATNAELIEKLFTDLLPAAGLWAPGCPVLDVTYHDGLWWSDFRPDRFEYHSRRDDPTFDFRLLDHPSRTFTVTAFDPPYVCKGGRDTSGIDEFDDRYGLTDAPDTPDDLLAMNIAGLCEAIRVTTHAVLLKSMAFVSGAELHDHTSDLQTVAKLLGWTVYDELVHASTGRPQPGGRRELHARYRPSTMTILVPYKFRKGGNLRPKAKRQPTASLLDDMLAT